MKPKPEAVQDATAAAERSLLAYSQQAWPIIRPGDKWCDGWAFGCLCEHLQAVVEGQIKKLGVACPPRHGKSIAANVMMPTQAWAIDPRLRFIFTSYAAKLSERDSMACREVIQSKWYQDRWGYKFKFKDDLNQQAIFGNTMGGFRIATTPGGWATGEGADIIVGDDLTSVEQAFSPAALDSAWRYWTQTMTLRFHDPESVRRILSMQRTAKGDVLGRAIAEGLGYEVVTLPFEAEPHRIWYGVELPPDDPDHAAQKIEPPVPPKHAIIPTSLQRARPELRDRRAEGEILWPERFKTEATIKDLKKSVKAGAAGQLQQRPEGESGAIFVRAKFRKFFVSWHPDHGMVFTLQLPPDAPPDMKPRVIPASSCMWYQTVDTALTAEQHSDYFVATTVAKAPALGTGWPAVMLVFNVFKRRLEVPEQWPAMKELRDGRARWDDEQRRFVVRGADNPWPAPLSFQAVESKNSGIGLMQTARSEGRPLKELVAESNKVLRASTVSTMYGDGVVYHNADGEWVEDFEEELATFPGAKDDQVDAIAYAGRLFVHDALVAAYTGDVVYNERVHTALAAQARLQEQGGYLTPGQRAEAGIVPQATPERMDDILAAIRGAPPVERVRVEEGGDIRFDDMD